MDSLPQEIIDKIIDNLPRSSLYSSSLVARRWRTKSQQRALCKIRFSAEPIVNWWHVDIQSHPDGISSHAQFAEFNNIAEWRDPALFCRVLENFTSLTTLWISQTEIPRGLPERIAHGDLGKVTALYLWSPRCSLWTVISTIFAFPNLQNLSIDDFTAISREISPDYPVLPQRGPLHLLRVVRCEDGVVEALANRRSASHHLILDVKAQNVQKLLILSSVTIKRLVLCGVYSLCVNGMRINDYFTDYPDQATSYPIDLVPQFPALTSLSIYTCRRVPSSHLLNTLIAISSVPALVSITLECWHWPPGPLAAWDGLDRRLAQMAKNTTVKGGLVLTLTRWPKSLLLKAFPKFREVGKVIAGPL